MKGNGLKRYRLRFNQHYRLWLAGGLLFFCACAWGQPSPVGGTLGAVGSDTMAGVKPYIKSNGYSFTVLIDEDTSIAQAYNPRSTLPFMVMLNRKGEIHKQIEGFQLSEAEHLVTEVKALVESK